METSEVVLILITVPDAKSAEEISTMLVETKLAACVNALPDITSVYNWQGKLNSDKEILLLVKTVTENFDKICSSVRKIHPYDLPEIIAVPISHGLQQYLAWVKTESTTDKT